MVRKENINRTTSLEPLVQTLALNIAMLSIHSSPTGDLGSRDTGGMSVYISELAKELGNQGHHIDIFTLNQKQSNGTCIQLNQNVKLYYLNIDKPGAHISKETLFDYLPLVLQALKTVALSHDLKFDLIHSHYWLSGILGIQIQDMWKLPHIITFHTTGASKNQACPNEDEPDIRIEYEKKLNRRCNRIISSTEREKIDLKNFYQSDERKITTIPCGVNLKLFTTGSKSLARKHLGYQIKEDIILFIGRYVPVKGLDRLFEAVECFKDQHRIRVLVVGGDDSGSCGLKILRKKIKNLNFTGSVDLIGRVDQTLLPMYYNAADVLVVSSYYESFGLVALESLACGTPVVSTSVGDLSNIIKKGAGFVLKTFNPGVLAEYIEQIFQKTKHGFFSPEYIRATVREYTWKNTARLVSKEYKKVIDGQPF